MRRNDVRSRVSAGVTRLSPDFSVGTDSASLTYDRSTDTIYGVGLFGAVLTLDSSTVIGTVVSTVSAGSITSAVYFDESSDTLFAVDGSLDDRLVEIEPSTGLATPVGTLGYESVNAMTRHGNGNVYAISNASNPLLTIDLATGLATSVASISFAEFNAIAYLPDTDQLPGLNAEMLVEVDVATGGLTTIGATQLDTLVFVPGPGTALLLGLGLFALRRRRSTFLRARSSGRAQSRRKKRIA